MRRPDKASGKAVKTRRQKTSTHHNALKTARRHSAVSADLQDQLDRRTRELNEALEQQTATSEVLRVISSSSGELAPVFESLLASAKHLCGAEFGAIFLREGDAFRTMALHGTTAEYAEARWRAPFIRPAADTGLGRVLETKQAVQIADVRAVAGYVDNPVQAPVVQLSGVRSKLSVPMLKEENLIGVIEIDRQEVRPFTDRQIDLVKTFAAQAVVAIENTRLLNELRQRTDDLTESLAQQTATSEVLSVISSSAGELQSVFETMLAKAIALCDASFGAMWLIDGDGYRTAALHGNLPEAYAERWRSGTLHHPKAVVPMVRAVRSLKPVHVPDMLKDQGYLKGDPLARTVVDIAGIRTLLTVPMLKENEAVGVITIYRNEVRSFSDKQIELVSNFAAQAVIAIENTRLLNELRESLQQQTATTDVLRVISSSPGKLEPVFGALLENATRICEARFGNMSLYNGETFQNVALHNPPDGYSERGLGEVIRPHAKSGLAYVARTKQIAHIDDIRTQPPYREGDPAVVLLADVAGARTLLIVPMLKENTLIGTIAIYRQEVRLFTDKQIELVQNFAAQAVIAIENARLLNELRESLEQQTATSEVLRVISSSPGELEPVFQAMLENAVRICDAKFGNLMLREEDGFLIGATYGAHPAYVEYLRSERVFANNTGLKQLVSKKEHYHVLDLASVRTPGDNLREATINLAGARTLIGVPMLKEDEVIGAIIIYRQEVRPFTDKQIELVKNFAAQAVVAIENTRLLNELRHSLEQQTATADVLKVISSSPGDLEPVFQSMLVKAVQICEAKFGVLFRCYYESEFRAVAWVGVTPEYEESLRERQSFRPDAGAPLGRLLLTKDLVHTADELAEKSGSPAAKYGGARSLIAVPMRKQNELVGALVIYRTEVRPFTEKQIELVRNFSAQAVIAIDNARLLTELRESLQQQTATADVLKVISRSTFDLQPVLDTLTESAARLCDADLANIWRPHGSVYRLAASHRSIESKAKDYLENISIEPSRGSCVGRTLLEARTVHIHDIQSDPEYALETSKLKGWRTMLGVPLLREGVPIGVIALVRSTQRPFTTQQIELVTTFADQAVIAIENVRLFDEVQSRTRELSEALKQQTATSEVLQVISSSPGELAPVFEAILGNATRICEANFGTLTQVVDGIPSLMFQRGVPAALEQYWRHETPKPSAHNAISRVIKTGQAVHVTDLQTNEAYIDRDPLAVAGVELGGIRTLLIVPMLKDGKTFGTIGIYRQEVRPFSDKQVELVSSFAAQAAIAIENTRLLKELRQRTDDLSKSLEDLRTAQDRLVQTQKLASLGQLTAGIAHEIKNPLNFVNNFSALSGELIDELQDTLKGISLNDKTRAELAELTNTLRGNLDKVVQHGKRADAIVKNMLLHSREGSGEHRLVDINAIVEESLNLAYHGARAEKQGFNITLERSFDPAAGELDVFPQDITRALLNLISNGFYAAVKRNAEGNGGDREPTLTAATRNLGDRVEIRIRDNGTGISPEVKEKIFNPFFTTKPAGEGTGLGLSISHDIVVKQHGGVIEVDTRPGEFTEIRVILPRVAALLLERS